jgi:hypothetical protein
LPSAGASTDPAPRSSLDGDPSRLAPIILTDGGTHPSPTPMTAHFARPILVYQRRARPALPPSPPPVVPPLPASFSPPGTPGPSPQPQTARVEPPVYHPPLLHRHPCHVHPMVTRHAAGTL